MHTRLFLSVLALLVFSWLSPQPALAYIPHLYPQEGFFVRQFSYLFFLVAMFILFFELRQEKLQQYRGFRFLAWASLLFALWNLNCFMGQFLAPKIGASLILGSAGSFAQQLLMADTLTWFYYFSKLDNLLLIPAFYLFYLGLKEYSRELKID
jgi:hypothetical protein